MKFHYDKEADVLYAFENGVNSGIFDEDVDGVWIRKDSETGKPIGFTILDYMRRKKDGLIKAIPYFPNIKIPY